MTDNASNTGGNTPQNKGHFKKGDPRINRLGRPKTFDALRSLGQQIAHEAAKYPANYSDKDKAGQPIVFDKHVATVGEMILRSWAQSNSPQLQRAFIEVAFGKVPDDVHLRIDRMSDAELAEAVKPYIERLGIRLDPPDTKRLDAAPDHADGDGGAV